jgi:thiopurine S-methyltransferase
LRDGDLCIAYLRAAFPDMNPEFWHKRWADSQIGFHEPSVNPVLVAHLDALGLAKGARVFVPLCGKTLDIDWLLARGYQVAGAELSSMAVAQLFGRLGVEPDIRRLDGLEQHGGEGLDIFVGDIFQLTARKLGVVDAIYDRAALVAMPSGMRMRYVQHLRALSGGAPQLLVTLEYDQSLADGPPFSVSAAEIRDSHPGREPALLSSEYQPMGLKGRYPVTQNVWKIQRS